ncbi:MAG: hypothetical protein IPM36_09580 [Lewinellaceae bacterium]|nr:hypothetical protein [Lewinellaceae bacterium]
MQTLSTITSEKAPLNNEIYGKAMTNTALELYRMGHMPVWGEWLALQTDRLVTHFPQRCTALMRRFPQRFPSPEWKLRVLCALTLRNAA